LYDGDIPPADSGLTLIRLGVVKLDHQAEENLTWALPNDPAQVKLFKAWKLDRGMKLVLAAGVPLRYRPKVTGDGRIRVPDRERERAEDALRTAANLISISDRSKRSISSPSPPVAFEASSPTGARTRYCSQTTHSRSSPSPFLASISRLLRATRCSIA
jgi:hypothetical protein